MLLAAPRTVAAALLVLLGGVTLHAAGCGGGPADFVFHDARATAAPRVVPGGKLAVTVTLVNAGQSALAADRDSLQLGEAACMGDRLSL
jgi:hypothetical protein